MLIYEVSDGPITVHSEGTITLGLMPAQVQSRRHKLKQIAEGKNLFRLTGETQFKTGERFSFDGDPKKAFRGQDHKTILTVIGDSVIVARRAVVIPDNWRSLRFSERQDIAARLTDEPVKNNEQVNAAIEMELAIRNPVVKAAE